MNIVIIDTCIFIDKEQDFFFETPILNLLKETRNVKVVMPMVIVEEITKRVEEIIDNINRTVKEKNTKLGKYKISNIYRLTNLDKNTVISDFRNKLLQFYQDNNIEIADYPKELTIQNILNRALSRKKPFKNDGGDAGFKDYLIWLTIIEIARKHPDDTIHFITANKKDFTNNESLHDDLKEDLSALNINNFNYKVFLTLEDFKNTILELQSIDDNSILSSNYIENEDNEDDIIVNENIIIDIINNFINDNIKIFNVGNISLVEYLEKNYETISNMLDITSEIFGYQVQFEDIGLPNLDISTIRFNNIDEEESYIEFQVNCSAEASIGGNWDGEYIGSCELQINISLTYNSAENIVENISIDNVEIIDNFSNDALYDAENAFHIRFINDNF